MKNASPTVFAKHKMLTSHHHHTSFPPPTIQPKRELLLLQGQRVKSMGETQRSPLLNSILNSSKNDNLTLKGHQVNDNECDALQAHLELVAVTIPRVELISLRGSLHRLLPLLLQCQCTHLKLQHLNQLDRTDFTTLGDYLSTSNCPLVYLDITSAFGEPSDVEETEVSENVNTDQIQHANPSAWTDSTFPNRQSRISPAASVATLNSGLFRNKSLETLKLEECFLRDKELAKICKALRNHPRLRNLILSGNKYGTGTSTALANLLQEPTCLLNTLVLDQSSIITRGPNQPKLNFGWLAQGLRQNTSLTTLDLTDNRMDDRDVQVLMLAMLPLAAGTNENTTAADVEYNTTLQHLMLGRNSITDLGFSVVLYEMLPHIRHMKTLALWGNLMEDITLSSAAGDTFQSPKIMKNRLVQVMVELQDVELLKAVSSPEFVPTNLWPSLLERLQRKWNERTRTINMKTEDAIYLMVRESLLATLGRQQGTSNLLPVALPNNEFLNNHTVASNRTPAWKINIRMLVEDCAESPSAYLQHFGTSPLAQIFLTDDRVASSFGRRTRSCIRKELEEAAALEDRIHRIYRNLQGISFANDNCLDRDDKNIVIWDLCCGKGFSAVWLSANTYPNAKICMVDNHNKTSRDYLNAFPNITFYHLDIYSSKLQDLILKSVNDAPGTKVILVGIHLCGDLSRRALELQSTCGADAALLSPCCAMRNVAHKKRKPGSFGVPQKARRLKVLTPYELWCWHLWGYANSSHSSHSRRLDLMHDTCMKTDKNAWLTVVDRKPNTENEMAGILLRD